MIPAIYLIERVDWYIFVLHSMQKEVQQAAPKSQLDRMIDDAAGRGDYWRGKLAEAQKIGRKIARLQLKLKRDYGYPNSPSSSNAENPPGT